MENINLRLNLSKSKKLLITGLISLCLITVLIFSLRKNIILVIDGIEHDTVTYKNTVEDVLIENNISLNNKDKIEPNLESTLSKNNIINITKAVDINLVLDGENLLIKSAESTIENMLLAEGFQFDDDDKILPSRNSSLENNMTVELVKVDIVEYTDIAPIEYTTKIVKDSNYIDTYSKVLKTGVNGEKEITSKIIYENGKEVDRITIQEIVLKEPIEEEVLKGSLITLNINRGGEALNAKKKIHVKATAYSPINGAKVAYTASGMKATRNEYGYSTIAVDPRIIPLGTKVYVNGYGYAIAADTGKSVKGNFIDVFFNTYKEACRWGLKYVDVYILE